MGGMLGARPSRDSSHSTTAGELEDHGVWAKIVGNTPWRLRRSTASREATTSSSLVRSGRAAATAAFCPVRFVRARER